MIVDKDYASDPRPGELATGVVTIKKLLVIRQDNIGDLVRPDRPATRQVISVVPKLQSLAALLARENEGKSQMKINQQITDTLAACRTFPSLSA